MTSKMPIWQQRPVDEAARQRLIGELRVSPLMARLLAVRGLTDPAKTELFLNATLDKIPDPFSLSEMDLACERIIRAVSLGEDVLIFGDYDVDGITGTAQLHLFLREMGLKTRCLLPHRLRDGYGLTQKSLERIIANPPKLLITIDNGTNALEEISFLKQKGIDVIVIDHHETPNQRPPVVALINPKRHDTPFEEKNIASAGLVFLLLMALRRYQRERSGFAGLEPNLKRYLDLATLGTVADVVPLMGLNRIIVKHGLKELETSTRPGIVALREMASVSGPVNPTTVAFRFAPRINAAGRMDDPTLALDLLLTENRSEALELATRLEKLNRERQGVEQKMIQEASEQVETEQRERRCLVVAKEGWHLGVAGIVAARLVDRYQKPAIVLVLEGETARGSGRTTATISIYDALTKANGEGVPLMERFGGHHAACGLTLKTVNLPQLMENLDRAMSDQQKSEASCWVDAFVKLDEINLLLLQEISQLEPFGAGNLEPRFATHEVSFGEPRIVGEKHLKGVVIQGETKLSMIAFGMASSLEGLLAGDKHQIIFSPQINEWNGQTSIQLKLNHLEKLL